MSFSPKPQEVVSKLETESPKMGDIKKLAKTINPAPASQNANLHPQPPTNAEARAQNG